ncbi:MAG: HD domain-containing phosphohydrolase [Eubacteriales bacterium]
MDEFSKLKNQTVLDNMTDGFVTIDANWCYAYINKTAGQLFQIDADNNIGKDIWAEKPDGFGVPFHPAYEEAMREQTQKVIPVYISWMDRWFENRIYPSKSGLHMLFSDITERRAENIRLTENERNTSVLLSNMPGLVYRCKYDSDWTLLYVSDGCHSLTGYSAEQLMEDHDISFNDLINNGYREKYWRSWSLALKERTKFLEEYPLIRSNGEIIWVLEQGQAVYTENGEVDFLEGLIIDITDRKTKELEVEYLLQFDFLTGASNRIYFERELSRLDTSEQLPISIIIGDINGLKQINDAFGQLHGDSLIKETSHLIQGGCRECDLLGRLGGDEFAILMPNTDNITADNILKNLKTQFEKYNGAVEIDMNRINISFGCATKDMADISMNSVIKLAEEHMYKRKLLERKSMHNSVVASIKTTMFAKSQETEEHAERLAALANTMGKKLNLQQVELNELELLATLHDIGKVGISDQILNKPGKLTEEEWDLMKMHSEIGYKIAMASPELMPIADYILSHHERWDGHGYPQGLAGHKIPLCSRILAVADAYDAMTEDRVYRKAMSMEDALEEIRKNSGTQFDPEVVDTFLMLIAG